jgi:hypothetical protein
MQRFLWLRRCINHTNANVVVEINSKKYTIIDLINLKKAGIEMMLDTYKSLNDDDANRRMNSMGRVTDTKAITIDRFYDEHVKNEAIADWRDLYDSIDSKLEIINATTDLIEIVPDPTIENEEPQSAVEEPTKSESSTMIV